MAKETQAQAPVGINLNVDDEEGLNVEEAIAKISMLLARVDNPKVLSDVDDKEIRLCAALYSVAERTKDKMVKNFIDNFLWLRVSHNRLGRKELIDLARAAKEPNDARFSRIRNMLGLGMR